MGYPHYILITGRIMVGLLQVSMAPAHDSAVLQEPVVARFLGWRDKVGRTEPTKMLLR